MSDHRLPKTVRNDVLARVQRAELSPLDFEWTDVKEGGFLYSRLTHKPTAYYFAFTATAGSGHTLVGIEFTPPGPDGSSSHLLEGGRASQLGWFSGWLNTVKAEHEAPDLWGALKGESDLMTADVAAEDDRPFSAEERAQVRKALDEIRRYLIAASGAGPAQAMQINVTFSYVADAADRLTKRDWKGILVNALVSLLITVGANPDVIHGTLRLTADYILPILGVLRLLP